MKALSIRQPWAWLIIHGFKDIENRTWKTSYRGPLLIHASKTLDREAYRTLIKQGYPLNTKPLLRGGIVGIVHLVDCVTASDSQWFTGPHGWVLRNARPLPFRPIRGRLGLFEVEQPVA